MPKTRKIETPENEPGLTRLRELCGDDKNAYQEMIELINDEVLNTLEVLPTHFNNQEFTSQVNVIHKVLSKIGILGLQVEQQQLLIYEQRLRKHMSLTSQEIEEIYDILKKALSIVSPPVN